MTARRSRGALPAVVVAAHGRAGSLHRLLESISRAALPASAPVIVSVDGGGPARVLEAARAGARLIPGCQVRPRQQNLGLREHILALGDLSAEHGGVVVLEDDLMVAPGFYTYAAAALDYYAGDEAVAGVSLYLPLYNEATRYPIIPCWDGASVLFAQVPNSWGQAWSAAQWAAFRRWYAARPASLDGIDMPPNVHRWPESSWKKYYYAYMVATDRYFAYPYFSLATNWAGRGGFHMADATDHFQSTLTEAVGGWRFVALEESRAVYDAYFEPLAHLVGGALMQGVQHLDLHGVKALRSARPGDRVLTSRVVPGCAGAAGLVLRPPELNLRHGVAGDALRVAPLERWREADPRSAVPALDRYYYGRLGGVSGMGVRRALRLSRNPLKLIPKYLPWMKTWR